ncbi:glutathione S-transferase family protein [Pseudoalteromonas xiamenensis]|uniref:glutathione S-transferase family protein n=1 Tax=Pseudoalteromonas xiamenensis TaxID=882626 RepID=UPI0027E42CC5|nr:glutathione S-transferase family protein [Pseudoalteromonas xiamenensis]WMN61384.1 glutathione S-transferase family protein [Pseudoalteromonas xiamenensis]
MYTLYYMTGACSLATQVVLRELGVEFKLINKDSVEDFKAINPVGAVPVLLDNGKKYTEGAAILLHLLDKHANNLFPASGDAREEAIQNLLFANATMHPAYSKLFFIGQSMTDTEVKQAALESAAQSINQLWKVVEAKLANQPFLGGNHYSAADILLTVYHSWGQYFPVDIVIGDKTAKLIDTVSNLPSFKASQEAEQQN